MLKIEWSGKLHDQEIMDWLESEINENAVTAYGEAIPDHMFWDDMEPIKNKLNAVLEGLGSSLRLLECNGQIALLEISLLSADKSDIDFDLLGENHEKSSSKGQSSNQSTTNT